VEGIVAVVISCRGFAESVGSDHGVFNVARGLWSASWRKKRFASICIAVEDRWWRMQLMNGSETTLLGDPLIVAGGCGPPMSRASIFLIRSAKPQVNGLHAPGPYHGKRPTKMLLTNRSSTKTKLQAQQIIKTIGNNKLEACDDTAERRRISAPSIFN
jgi:hypothetical protein